MNDLLSTKVMWSKLQKVGPMFSCLLPDCFGLESLDSIVKTVKSVISSMLFNFLFQVIQEKLLCGNENE